MLTLHVTSDSTPDELRAAADFLITLASNKSCLARSFETSEPQIPLPLPIPLPVLTAPPATPAAIAPPAPAPAASDDTGATDADGLPWDARIHSSGRDKNSDGRWRKRRNVDEAVVTAVTAELRTLVENMHAGRIDVVTHVGERPTDVIVPPPPVAAAPVPPPPPLDPVAAFAQPAVVPVPPPPAVEPTVSSAPTTFVEFMPKIVALLSEKRLSHDDLTRTLVANGVANLGSLGAAASLNPALIPTLWASICALPGVLA